MTLPTGQYSSSLQSKRNSFMFSKISAALVAAFIILLAYILPLALPVAAARILPGVELNYSLSSFFEWCFLLVATAFLLWIAEMFGKYARAQSSIFSRTRPYALYIGFLAELIISSLVFRLIISSLLISVLCALLLMLLSALIEEKIKVPTQTPGGER